MCFRQRLAVGTLAVLPLLILLILPFLPIQLCPQRSLSPTSFPATQKAPPRPTRAQSVHLEEFKALRTELVSKLDAADRARQYLVALLAAILGISGAVLGVLRKEATNQRGREGQQNAQGTRLEETVSHMKALERLLGALVLTIPILAAPFAFIFVDNSVGADRIAYYINKELRPELVASVGGDETILGWDRMNVTHRGRGIILISILRLVLFVIPTGGVIFSFAVWWPWRLSGKEVLWLLLAFVFYIAVLGGLWYEGTCEFAKISGLYSKKP